MNEHTIKKVEFQVKQQSTVQTSKVSSSLIKKEEAGVAGQTEDCRKSLDVKTNIHPVAPAQSVSDTRQNSSGLISQSSREARVSTLKQQEVDVNVNKLDKARAEDPKRDDSAKVAAAAKDKQNGMMNGAIKGDERALMNSHKSADISKPQGRSTAEGKAVGSQLGALRPSVTPLPLRHTCPPAIELESLDAKGSCDEVQSMEVR